MSLTGGFQKNHGGRRVETFWGFDYENNPSLTAGILSVMSEILPLEWIQWLTIFNTIVGLTATVFAIISGINRFFVRPDFKVELHTHDSQVFSGIILVKYKILNATIVNKKTWKFGRMATHCEGKLILGPGREHPLCWIDYGDRQIIDLTPGNSATLELVRIVVDVNRATIRLPGGSETTVDKGPYTPVLRVTSKETTVEKSLGELRIPEDISEKPLFRRILD